MNFELTENQKEYRHEIIEFARQKLNSEDYFELYNRDMFQEIADFGLLGITVSEEYGGLAESYLTAAVAIEALGYGCKNNGFVFVVNNHIWVAQNLIYLYGSRILKDKYLHGMINGSKMGAIAITEADSGSDALSMKTTAVKTEGGYLLNGSKMFISNGPVADIFIVFASTDVGKITAFVVEKTFKGVMCGEPIRTMGLGACPLGEVTFDYCLIPKENVLGRLHMGNFILTSALEWERFYEFVPHLGAMQRVMETCIRYAGERKQFGHPISEYQSVSHKIADMKVSIEMGRLMMYRIAVAKDEGRTVFLDTSIFKLYVSEHYIRTCRDAIQILGAYGYTKEYEVERELRDALACSIYSGTNEIQRNTIFQLMAANT